ncbi:Cytochrome b5-like heme/steroid binding domain [Ostreococcus tauri]|uniref:Cytochrome b5-like heme/steroid binding domain n=1 Tax=Ostreococcus tauri TaxID=70448 RepID=A0A090MC85_OSTTA|nr:Cytochrome b5-like heme/steroid binding domain [Ostreococcus tauri]CEG01189.1 Cytochrome b5-like heme/steroid binding domain [Ostreococcus tauri]|eukprot:XP_022840832.1 Cytochrome b5-like heme/steroid binding domain [Ostreococcus tauri]
MTTASTPAVATDANALETYTAETLAALTRAGDPPTCALACDGLVFDVSSGREFYGVDGPYAALNGRDATRALATMTIASAGVEWARTRGVERGRGEDAGGVDGAI